MQVVLTLRSQYHFHQLRIGFESGDEHRFQDGLLTCCQLIGSYGIEECFHQGQLFSTDIGAGRSGQDIDSGFDGGSIKQAA